MAQSVEHVLGKDEVPGPIPGRGLMQKKYISVDVETSGKTPGKYSMLSLGACVVGDTSRQFYAELKPLNDNFIDAAMRIACLGLNCLDGMKHIDKYNPERENFNPSLALNVLKEKGEEPKVVIPRFNDWVNSTAIGYRPIIAAAPIIFDGMFVSWYFDNFFEGENPFGHSGEDISSMYRGSVKNIYSSIKDLGLRTELTHNALDDAIQQAIEFEKILDTMNRE